MGWNYYDHYDRKETFPVEFLLPLINKGSPKIDLAGEQVSLASTRLLMYKLKGTQCVKCGLKAKYFALEMHKKHKKKCTAEYSQWHLNLYACNKNGKETMMTQDHIIPKSKGGSNELDNLQPMCIMCNMRKGNTHEQAEVKVASL